MTALILATLLSLANEFGSAQVDTHGARVVSYRPTGGEEVLAALPSGMGGIPLCWPWFQYNGPKGTDSPKHGLARSRDFDIVSQSPEAVVLKLRSDEETRKAFPYDFELTVTVRLSERLELEMRSANTGTQPFQVTEAFHPYIRREALAALEDDGTGRFRTWDPDETSHLKTQGLSPADWKTFLCVENGVFSPEEAVWVRPGETHTLRRWIGGRSAARRTAALQRRIDAVSAAGGGSVCPSGGDWTVASLRLKDGVTLRLAADVRLLASTNYADYVNTSGENRGAVVWAEDAARVAIEGEGVIDGRGGLMPRVWGVPGRWRDVVFTRCRDVRIEGVTIRNAHTWACYLKLCDGVTVRNVTIRNHVNHNNDGLDIASKNVVVENCDIDSEDDALVFKSPDPDFVVENVRVRDCRLSSNSGFVKIGTESFGGFRNIDVRACELGSRQPITVRPDYLSLPGVSTLRTGAAGVSVLVVDGGFAEDVTVSDIRMKNGILVPFCVRLDKRRTRKDGGATYLRNVTFERIEMEEPSTSWLASTVTGASGLSPSNVVFRNVRVRPLGCAEAAAVDLPVLEMAGGYPGGSMFRVPTPASGFFVRHADDVRFERVDVLPAGADLRRPIVVDDAEPRKPDRRSLIGSPAWDLRFETFKSSADGTVQPFYWYNPIERGAVPLVVVLHTWSANCFTASPATTVAAFCEKRGWAMAYPNFRGPNVRSEACGGDLAVQDVLDVIGWVKRIRPVDADRVYVIGGSGGGHMALLMAGRHPEVFAGAAAFCPITDLARWYVESVARKNRYAGNITAACGGLPDERPDEYAKRSPLSHLSRARELPVYIATGIHDGHRGSVPVGHAIRGFNALADESDRISEANIARIERDETVPHALRFGGIDPFYDSKTRVHMRLTSANVRLTLFEGGHQGNYPAGLDFLARQRRGRKADMTLPNEALSATIENVTQ